MDDIGRTDWTPTSRSHPAHGQRIEWITPSLKIIADSPSAEMYQSGLEIDCQCARCGSSVNSERCDQCEDGFDGHECGEDCCVCAYPAAGA